MKGVAGNDDYAAMEEVLTRRLTAYLDERDRPLGQRGQRPAKFAYPPQLLARRRRQGPARRGRAGGRRTSGSSDEIPVASLAKRFEEVYVPGRADPVDVPRQSEALFLLQRIRDEAHRFANTLPPRAARQADDEERRSTTSPGSGRPARSACVKELGGVDAVKQATLDELQALSWLPDAVAEARLRQAAR